MRPLFSTAFGLVAGMIGWILAEFFAKPFRRGVDLVAAARVEVIRYANVAAATREDRAGGPSQPVPDFSEDDFKRLRAAEDMYRELGAKFTAFSETEPLATSALRVLGLRLDELGPAFIGLSNSVHEYGSQRAAFSERVDRALRFRRPDVRL